MAKPHIRATASVIALLLCGCATEKPLECPRVACVPVPGYEPACVLTERCEGRRDE